jgi:nucleoside permease NupC
MSQNDIKDVKTSDVKASSAAHHMSIALVIGATIGLIGLIILLYGLFGHPDLSRSDNINIDLWWGLVMVIFGIIMGGGSYLITYGHRS